METENNKFTESELIVGGLGFLFIDGICILIDLTVVGWTITPVIQTAATFGIEQWVESKGGNLGGFSAKRLGKYIVNAFPYLPTTFIIFLASALMHNNPAVGALAQKAAGPKITEKLKKTA